MVTIKEIQIKLAEMGFDPGAADGLMGRRTMNALTLFQKAVNLEQTGQPDGPTMAAMFGRMAVDTVSNNTPWMTLAKTKMGLHESINKAQLMSFLKLGKGTIGDPAVTPWCGDFVETCIAVSLPKEVLPSNPYAAINWATFGKAVTPCYGAILSFHRGDPAGWQGHVGFYVSEDAGYFHVLGGNQANSVSITKIAKNRLRPNGSRWPLTGGAQTTAVKADGTKLVVTTNES